MVAHCGGVSLQSGMLLPAEQRGLEEEALLPRHKPGSAMLEGSVVQIPDPLKTGSSRSRSQRILACRGSRSPTFNGSRSGLQ
jgi:hypothetical protein